MTVVNALDRQAGGPDDNSAQAGHLIPLTAKCLTASERWDAETETFIPGAPAFHMTQDPISGPVSPALGKKSTGMGAQVGPLVRRLTPVECERLMSWPDDWTAPVGVVAPDSRRYAACGDGVVANVAEWIGRRVLAVDDELRRAA